MRKILLFLLMLLPMAGNAFDFEVDGIYYNIINENEVEVTFYSYDEYSGSVIIPSSVIFNGITYSVTSIGDRAFYSCDELTNVTIGNLITTIGYSAFGYCNNLTSVTIGNSVTAIGRYAFEYCSRLDSISFPNSVTTIEDHAFTNCYGLTSVSFSDSITTIGQYAFQYCSGLTSVTIPESVTNIGWYAFKGCSALNTLNFNAINCLGFSSEWVEVCPFYKTGISTINIGNRVQRIPIGFAAGLSRLTSITIPSSVTTVGSNAFINCNGLTSVHIQDLAAWCNINFENNAANPLRYAHKMYLNDIEITELTIPNSVTAIGNYAFSNFTDLTSVTIGNSVTSIGDYAFNYCTGLAKVSIPSSVSTIGDYAFDECSGLSSVHIEDLAAWCNISFSNYVSNPCYYAHHLFMNGEEIKDLIIPNHVTSIGKLAFEHCYELTSITIPNSVTAIGNNAFMYCSGVTSVTIGNSVTTLGTSAFSNCIGLKNIIIPNSVTIIDNSAFRNCSGLTNITLGNSLDSIGHYAFNSCTGLTNIEIPNSVTFIGARSFYGCNNLSSIEIPNSVITINEEAFSNCGSNMKLIISGEGDWQADSIGIKSSIVLYVDSRITSLCGIKVSPSVYCYASTPPICDENTFTRYSGTLHVPAASLAAYFTADYWCNFANIVGDAIELEEVNISQDSVEMIIGDQFNLTAVVSPANATPNNIIWKSTNTNIATVYNGRVTAKGVGECDIIARCLNKKAICHVVVNDTTATITLDQQEAMVLPNHIITITPSASPVLPDLAVTSSDPSVAAARVVNNKIQVVGIKEGTTMITVGSVDGTAIPATCLVTVYTEPGDINCDGFVNISDVTSLIDYLLSGENSQISTKNADVNGDENINISDVTTLIDILLSGNG